MDALANAVHEVTFSDIPSYAWLSLKLEACVHYLLKSMVALKHLGCLIYKALWGLFCLGDQYSLNGYIGGSDEHAGCLRCKFALGKSTVTCFDSTRPSNTRAFTCGIILHDHLAKWKLLS